MESELSLKNQSNLKMLIIAASQAQNNAQKNFITLLLFVKTISVLNFVDSSHYLE